MDEIVVRPVAHSDAPRLSEIWMDAAEYYAELDSRAFQVPLRDDVDRVAGSEPAEGVLSLVAEIGGGVAGFVDAHVEEPVEHAGAQFVRELAETRVVIDALVVERSFWRRGAGTALLRAAEDWGRGRGASIVCLDTYVHSPVSVPFYEKGMGYQVRSLNLRKRL